MQEDHCHIKLNMDAKHKNAEDHIEYWLYNVQNADYHTQTQLL